MAFRTWWPSKRLEREHRCKCGKNKLKFCDASLFDAVIEYCLTKEKYGIVQKSSRNVVIVLGRRND